MVLRFLMEWCSSLPFSFTHVADFTPCHTCLFFHNSEKQNIVEETQGSSTIQERRKDRFQTSLLWSKFPHHTRAKHSSAKNSEGHPMPNIYWKAIIMSWSSWTYEMGVARMHDQLCLSSSRGSPHSTGNDT